MGVIKVETFDVTITANGSTHTLTNDIGNLDNGFVRLHSSSDKGVGRTDTTGNLPPNATGMGMALTGTDEITFTKNTSNPQRVFGEVWRYTGAGGADEFIVRGRYSLTIASGTNSVSQSLTGVVNKDRCIPIHNGFQSSSTSTSDFETCTVAVHINSSGNLIVSRNNNSSESVTVNVTVVEFTGSNWSVGHGISSSHDTIMENITLNTDSTGSGGGTFNVGNWSRAIILDKSMEGDTSETGIGDIQITVLPVDETTVSIGQLLYDNNARNDGDAYCHVLVNDGLIVNRETNTNVSEGNNSTGTLNFPAASSTTDLIEDLALEWHVGTSGTGTAHARGRLTARITSATGTITHYVHRSGNTVRVDWGVIELNALTDTAFLSIVSVDGDNVLSNSQTGIEIIGAEFGTTQGSGFVEIGPNADYSGSKITQTINSWSDTSINFDLISGVLTDSIAYLFVTNNDGGRGVIGIVIGVPPLTSSEIIQLTSPDHYIPLHINYVATIGGQDWSTRVGSPSFETVPLTRGSVGSIRYNSTTEGARMPDNNEMNLQSETTRQLMFVFRLGVIPTAPSCPYEEGGSVNNWAVFISPGGILISQLADTNDDNVHCFTDFVLETNRTYFMVMNFDYTQSPASERQLRLYIDGVLQSKSFGNPLTSTDLDAHSGDISSNLSESSLEVFGTDITFPGMEDMNKSDFSSWTSISSDTELRVDLFEKIAIPDIVISSGTQIEMQADIDTYSDTVRPNAPIAIEIKDCGEGDFTLTLDNITFNAGCSVDVQYSGVDILTIIKTNGTKIDSNKLSTINSGSIIIQDAVPILITVLDINTKLPIENARVLLEANSGGDLILGDDIIPKLLTDVNGQVSTTLIYTNDQPVKGVVRKATNPTLYKESIIINTITENGLKQTIFMIPD